MGFSNHMTRLRPRPSVDAAFLAIQLHFLQQSGFFESVASNHVNQASIATRQLARVEVVVPPLDEQRRIVAILEDHLSHIDCAQRALDATIRRCSVMTKQVLLRLVPGQESYPESWESTTVGKAGLVELGRQRHPDWHVGSNMKPYLRVANVFEDRLALEDVMEMHWPDDTFRRFRLQPGDVLLNEGQSPHLLGRPAIYRGDPPEVAFTNSLLRFRAHPGVLPEFSLLVFRRHMHAGRFIEESRITTNIAHLSASRLKAVEFPVPPLAEQKAIIETARETFRMVDAARNSVVAVNRHLAALRRSLLAAVFRGDLTRDFRKEG
jgi:type I restriction enzyme S subunit